MSVPTAVPTVKPNQNVTVAAVKLAATPKVTKRALRGGLTIKVAAPGAGTVSATLAAGRKTIARGSAKATSAGTVTVRFPKIARQKAKAKKVTPTIALPGATPQTTTLRVK